LLAEIAEDCVRNGFRGDQEPLKTLNSILNRPSAELTSSDWQFLVDESILYSYCVLDENRERVYDYVEKAPKIVEISTSELVPFEELLGRLRCNNSAHVNTGNRKISEWPFLNLKVH
jgi:hypothetical protein